MIRRLARRGGKRSNDSKMISSLRRTAKGNQKMVGQADPTVDCC